ncbi:uncharacterized protein [Palaemon carinicauda]|uniref:uncharacterized protein n=1 Tax=Palaemon carinicauda TaxID=392227 RepID=UPI0035B62B6C
MERYEQLLKTNDKREELGEADRVERPLIEIRNIGVKQALSRMKNGKPPGLSDVQIERIKILAIEEEEWMPHSSIAIQILDERLREIVKIWKQQYKFKRLRGTVDDIFIVRQLYVKRLEENQKVFSDFVYLGKAYDKIKREVMLCCMGKRKVPENSHGPENKTSNVLLMVHECLSQQNGPESIRYMEGTFSLDD